MKNNSQNTMSNSLLNYLQRFFCLVTEYDQHLELSFDLIKEVLLSSELNISSEIEVFNAADSWIKHDFKHRSKFALELLKTVRLSLLTSVALRSLLERDNVFSNYFDCTEYIKTKINKEKVRSIQRASEVIQNRHYNQDRFHMTCFLKKDLNLNRFQLYNVEPNNNLKPTRVTQYNDQFLCHICLFINGVFYFIGYEMIKCYSTFTNEWRKLIKYKFTDRSLYSICAFMGNIYILGGCRVDGRVTNRCSVFAPKSIKFKSIAPLILGRMKATSVVHGGRIVVSGGNGRNHGAKNKKVEVYDHIANQWSRMPDMLVKRCEHSSLSIRNKIYMLDGSFKQSEVFDSFSNKFSFIKSVASFHKLVNRDTGNCNYVVIGNKIVLIDRYSFKTAVFDVEKEEWSEVEDFMKIKSLERDCISTRIPKY